MGMIWGPKSTDLSPEVMTIPLQLHTMSKNVLNKAWRFHSHGGSLRSVLRCVEAENISYILLGISGWKNIKCRRVQEMPPSACNAHQSQPMIWTRCMCMKIQSSLPFFSDTFLYPPPKSDPKSRCLLVSISFWFPSIQ